MTPFRMMLGLLGLCWIGVSIAEETTQSAFVPQIQIDAVIYEVDPAKLAKLADTTKSPVAEFLKLNGFHQVAADRGPPWFVLATRKEPLSLDILGQDTVWAFKRLTAPTVTVLSGRKATVHFGGQFPTLIPVGNKSDRDMEIQWMDFGTKLTLIPIVEPDGRIKLEVHVDDRQLDDATAVAINGVAYPGLTVKTGTVSGEFKLQEHLLIADGTSESDLTRIVQLTPRLMTDAEMAQPLVANLPPSEPQRIQQQPTQPAALLAETS